MKIDFLRFKLSIDKTGLYVVFRTGTPATPAFGFVIKPRRLKMFSERVHAHCGFSVGPVYIRTFARRDGKPERYDWYGIDRGAVLNSMAEKGLIPRRMAD